VNATIEGLRHLGVDLATKSGQTPERRLNVAAGAAKTVVQIEVAERSIEVVKPHQTHDAAAEPAAFGIAGWPADGLGGLHELIGLALIVLGRIAGLRAIGLGLVLGVSVAALGGGGACRQSKSGNEPDDGEVAQDRILKLVHPTTHRFPDLFSACCLSGPAMAASWLISGWLDAVQIGPQCGGDACKFHDGHFGFCPASSQLYRVVVKPRPNFDVPWSHRTLAEQR